MSAKQFCHPLHQAIAAGDLKRIKRLVRLKSIDINKIETISGSAESVTPLTLAMTTTYPRNAKLRTHILQLLLSHPHIDINIYLQYVSKSSIDNKSVHNFNKENGTCLLHIWIKEGELELVSALVRHPKIDSKDVEDGVVIAIASEHLRKPTNKKLQNEIIKVLLSHPDVTFDIRHKCACHEDNTRTYLLRIFIANGELDLVKALVEHPKIKVDDVSSGIGVAIEDEYLCNPANKKVPNDIIKTLLEHPNVDVNAKHQRYTAIHVAVAKEQVKTVETLLEHPEIDVNVVSSDPSYSKSTPLLLALKFNKTARITKLLLDHPKIDVNKTSIDLPLPLNLPIRDKRSFECFEMLLNHKNIDVNVIAQLSDKFQTTPLFSRILERKYKEESEKTAFPNSKYYEGKAFSLLLNHHNIDLTITTTGGRNILHHMMLYVEDSKDDVQYCNMISEVLENHPYLIRPDENGQTPIDFAKELPDSFGLMDKVLEKYFQRIDKENTEVNSSDKEPSKSEDKKLKADLKKCCWNCDAKDEKLYKCKGCKKAYYCSKDCITEDWPVHGGYCLKQNKNKKQNK